MTLEPSSVVLLIYIILYETTLLTNDERESGHLQALVATISGCGEQRQFTVLMGEQNFTQAIRIADRG